MSDISKIKLPNGSEYNLKDSDAIHKSDDIPRTNVGTTSDVIANGIDEVTRPLVGAAASNKTFGLPASQITIEYSRDGGSTWVDYDATDTQKIALFAETRSASFRLGKVTSTADNNTNNMLRVTISREDRYVSIDCLYIWASTQGNSWTVDLDKSTIGAKTTFTNVFKGFSLGGWSGNNVKYFPSILFGGGDWQTSQAYALRLTFKQTSIRTSGNYGPPNVIDVRFYGTDVWTAPNSIVASNHLYKWNENLDATFPTRIYVGNVSDTAERDLDVVSKSGRIELYATGTDTGSKGIMVENAAGTTKVILRANQNNEVTLYGNVSGKVNSHTVDADVPSGAEFTDTKTRQTLHTGNTNRPLLMASSANTVTTYNVDSITYRNNDIYANPSTGLLTAKNFANSKGTIGASYDSSTETITITL